MAIPEGRGVHVDQYLTNVILNYRPRDFIAEDIFPVVAVPKQSDAYLQWTQADLFRRPNTRRSPATEANLVHVDASSAKFFCENYALADKVTLEDRENADPLFVRTLEEGKVMRLRDFLLLDAEVRIADQITSASNVGSAVAVASAWNDYANADPLSDIWTVIDNVRIATGYRPSRVLFSQVGWDGFSRNDKVISKVNPSGGVLGGGPTATPVQAAALLQVDQVLVGAAAYNTAGEGIPQSLSDVWGENVVVYYAPPRPSMEVPSAGYTFRWQRPAIPDMAVERHPYDSRRKAQFFEVGVYQDEVISGKPLINLIQAVNSSTTGGI